jgi:hypothetical protein
MSRASICFACGTPLDDEPRFLLVRGGGHQEHCSDACLNDTLLARRKASAARERRWFLALAALVALVVAGNTLVRRHLAPPPQSISLDALSRGPIAAAPRAAPGPPAREPGAYGPPWPPTDADWMAVFAAAKWIYPMPGPHRRAPSAESRILAPLPWEGLRPDCRVAGRCAVALGGELWGEHVYAVQDGIVDRAHRDDTDEPGGASIRIAHFGGAVFTHYAHLAGMPREVVRGARIKAGQVIGLVGDSGTENPRTHLHFALSIRAAPVFPEIFWDPAPLMAEWPLRLPQHGTVAGLVPAPPPKAVPRRRR